MNMKKLKNVLLVLLLAFLLFSCNSSQPKYAKIYTNTTIIDNTNNSQLIYSWDSSYNYWIKDIVWLPNNAEKSKWLNSLYIDWNKLKVKNLKTNDPNEDWTIIVRIYVVGHNDYIRDLVFTFKDVQ